MYKRFKLDWGTNKRTQYLYGIISVLQPIEDKIIIAGGCLAGLIDSAFSKNINDVDIFIVNSKYQEEIFFFFERTLKAKKIFKCPNNELTTYVFGGVKYQVIADPKLIRSSPEDLINEFDFTTCQLALFKRYLITTKQAIRDIKNRVLNIHKITYPIATMNRIYKYKRKGFKCKNAFEQFLYIVQNNTFPEENLVYTID